MLLSAWIACCSLHVAHAQSAPPFAGTLKAVVGDVQVLRADQTQTAQSGMKLKVDDEVITGEASSAGIVLLDGTRLSLGPKSQTRMSEVSFDGTTQDGNLLIKLYRGSLRMITGLIATHNPDAVKVVTPTSVVGIRGTDFIVQVAE
jgi:hypothetical protein